MTKSMSENASRRDEFKSKLATDTQYEMPALNWSAIEAELPDDQNVHSEKGNVVNLKLQSKVKQLQVALVGMAAAILVVLLVPFSSVDDTKNGTAEELRLLVLIDENRVLQDRLTAQNVNQTGIQMIEARTTPLLDEIDLQIQRAYLENASVQIKIALWERRRQIITDAFDASESSKEKSNNILVI